ncbi:MAG: methyltransferase domain-containing protein [Candidatus Eremiobacteraeota bacterium]|nr:methyltransferase domain-containing protein [Candidatus Eremiobacteraeota bacterium]
MSENICVDWANSLHKNDYLDYECDLTVPLPFDDAVFDTIILSDVLEHVPRPEALWNEMHRVLRPGAKLLLNVPFFYWLHEQPHDYARYTCFALKRFAEEAGFEVLHLNSIGGVPEVLTDIFAKTALRIPRFGEWIALSAQRITSLFVSTRLGARVSKATRDDFPLGYFLVAEKKLL